MTQKQLTTKIVFADNQKGVSFHEALQTAYHRRLRKAILLKGQGKGIREIRQELKCSASTISRELKRGYSWRHPYTPSAAKYRYRQR